MKTKLTPEEKEILHAFETGKLAPAEKNDDLLANLKIAARNTLKKSKRVNIRISEKDLSELQVKAIEDGIPYQTLMSSVLHKYVSGKLREKSIA